MLRSLTPGEKTDESPRKQVRTALQRHSMSDNQPGLVYLITGGSGFLGKHLVRLLLEKEDKVTEIRVFDKCPDPRLKELSTGEKRSRQLRHDRLNQRITFIIFIIWGEKSHKYDGLHGFSFKLISESKTYT